LVSERRAVVLVLAGRAEPVATPDEPQVWHSPAVSIDVPSIVRLHHVVRLPSRVRLPPLTRRAVLLRDNYRCAYCDEPGDTIDHIVPRSRGGRHEWTNVVTACRRHNTQKGDRLLNELGWFLRVEPRIPDGLWWRWRNVIDPDPLWEPFLPQAS
jgi:5-methylcytosine-specific restriction endonuclease McrA